MDMVSKDYDIGVITMSSDLFIDMDFDKTFDNEFSAPGKPLKRILIIGHKGEFLVNSLENDLRFRGYVVDVVNPTITEISKVDPAIHIYMFVMESIDDTAELFVYLRDQVFDKQLHIFIICPTGEEGEIKKILPPEDICAIFTRPVNIKEIGQAIDKKYAETKGESKKKSILIIDDDPVFLRKTQNLLRKEYKTYIATSGTAAVMILAKHMVDLILLDYEMPIIDGPHVYQMIKAESGLSSIPIMFLSGKADVESVKTAIQLKPERYIAKMTKADEFLFILREYFLTHVRYDA